MANHFNVLKEVYLNKDQHIPLLSNMENKITARLTISYDIYLLLKFVDYLNINTSLHLHYKN